LLEAVQSRPPTGHPRPGLLCRAYEWPHRSGSISYALTRIF
jgi:hypothetical protein